jgi:DNA-binding NtrC family response regulator
MGTMAWRIDPQFGKLKIQSQREIRLIQAAKTICYNHYPKVNRTAVIADKKEAMGQILVLDDVLDVGIMIRHILERKGHRVAVFTEEQEALEHVSEQHVDVAILDIRLKEMSGVAVLEKMKQISPRTRVIMLTGLPTLETARQAQQLGAFEYCVKPIDKVELEEKVACALEAAACSE